MTALCARPEAFVIVKFLMHLRDRILPIVADFNRDLINLLAAVVAIPDKVILFAASALAFENDKPGVLFDPRRVRHAARTKQHLAGFDDRGLLVALAIYIDKILHAAQLHCDLIARVDVKIFALLATAAEKCQRLGILPQDAPASAFSLDLVNHTREINGNELFHEPTIALSKAPVQQDWQCFRIYRKVVLDNAFPQIHERALMRFLKNSRVTLPLDFGDVQI